MSEAGSGGSTPQSARPVCPSCGGTVTQAVSPGVYACLSSQVIGVVPGYHAPPLGVVPARPVHQPCGHVFRWGQRVGPMGDLAELANACQVDECGYPGAGRCTWCRKPFCDFHRAPSHGMTQLFDKCAACDHVQEEERKGTERRLRSLPDRLRAADIPAKPLYEHDIQFVTVRHLFRRETASEDVFKPFGWGWEIGSFEWEVERRRYHWDREPFVTVIIDEAPEGFGSDVRYEFLEERNTVLRALRYTDEDGDFLVVRQGRRSLGDAAEIESGTLTTKARVSVAQATAVIDAVDALLDGRPPSQVEVPGGDM
jgi:hypothetical protein